MTVTPLECVRRADWRFLLPEELPQDAAFVGDPPDALCDALSLVCARVTVIRPGAGRPAGAPRFRMVVVQHAQRASLELGSSLLEPGGWLYCEVDRRLPRHRREAFGHGRSRAPALPADYAKRLHTSGLIDVSTNWHYPDFDRCRCLVPLTDAGPGVRHLRRDSRSSALRLLEMALRLPFTAGLLPRVLPCVSLIGRKPVAVAVTP